jgi:Meiotically up-regulated gene 113/Domain of unknown function (DUF4041)
VGIIAFLLFVICSCLVIAIVVIINKNDKQIREMQNNASFLQERVNSLSKYERIEDVDVAVEMSKAKLADQERLTEQKIMAQDIEMQNRIKHAQEEADVEISVSRKKAKEARNKYEEILETATEQAGIVIENARLRAEEIAGEALIAKRDADKYEMAIRALKNTVKGYGDEYLVPHSELIDGLADAYSHKEAGQELEKARSRTKQMVKSHLAADCDYSEPKRRETALRFALDAFNGKVDAILSVSKQSNWGQLRQQIADAFGLVNLHGEAFRKARIVPEYLASRMDELKWLVAVTELRREEQEEQRLIKQEMREEQRAKKEYAKAIKEASKEEGLLKDAMKKAQAQMEAASAEQKAKYEDQLRELELKIKEAEERNVRAIAMAELTKRGHVYIISNVGSFGENVFKIGLTRRLEPMLRIKELGDASVPFEFDVHAMIYSEDAPSLEKALHKDFDLGRVNKVNPRKEFFHTNLKSIKEKVDKIDIDVHWTMKSEALEYRESLAIEKKEMASKHTQTATSE